MKRKYLVIIVLLMFFGITSAKALVVGDCKVLLSFKLSSSLDEDSYICKGTSYGNSGDAIYYDGTGNTVYLNNLEVYYLSNWNEEVTLNISGDNNVILLHVSDMKYNVTGKGSLKFKQNSFAKQIDSGESVYTYVYKEKTVLDSEKKIFEGTQQDFIDNYDSLKELNKLPDEYNEEDYVLVQAEDYTKMTSVVVTDSWFSKNVSTSLDTSVVDGYGIIKYVEHVEEVSEEQVKETSQSVLQTDNVIFISDKKVNKKYKLKEENLKDKEVAQQLSKSLDDQDLISFYDVSVYNGQKEVEMKDGSYTIKIRLDEDVNNYESYQIVYVDGEGKIAEAFDGYIEDGYIVFNTSHLSQYAVIGKQISEEAFVADKKFDWNLFVKLAIIGSFIIVSLSFLAFIDVKSNLHTKKRKRKRA